MSEAGGRSVSGGGATLITVQNQNFIRFIFYRKYLCLNDTESTWRTLNASVDVTSRLLSELPVKRSGAPTVRDSDLCVGIVFFFFPRHSSAESYRSLWSSGVRSRSRTGHMTRQFRALIGRLCRVWRSMKRLLRIHATAANIQLMICFIRCCINYWNIINISRKCVTFIPHSLALCLQAAANVSLACLIRGSSLASSDLCSWKPIKIKQVFVRNECLYVFTFIFRNVLHDSTKYRTKVDVLRWKCFVFFRRFWRRFKAVLVVDTKERRTLNFVIREITRITKIAEKCGEES